jgi:hypothetical protein
MTATPYGARVPGFTALPGMIAHVKSSTTAFPVTVRHLPVVRCQICKQTVAYRPGQASAVLTEHYRRAHPETLEEAAERS